MATLVRKTDLSPVESLIVERALGERDRTSALARIQALTQERQTLYRSSATHPLRAAAQGARIRTISLEIERLWELVRRERAAQRVRFERALNVVAEPDDDAETEPRRAPRRASSHTPDAA